MYGKARIGCIIDKICSLFHKFGSFRNCYFFGVGRLDGHGLVAAHRVRMEHRLLTQSLDFLFFLLLFENFKLKKSV
jgi:hypothetical protein